MGPRRKRKFPRTAPKKANEKFVHAFVNLPSDCLRAKLVPMLKSAENKDTFMARIGEIHAPTSKKYRLIERAYDTAQRDFRELRRDTGEAYFEHLRASAIFAIDYLRETRANVICAILLHDILEDLPLKWSFEKLAAKFNKKIARMVWRVTKPVKAGRIETDEDVDAAYHEKLLGASRKELVIKLVDRLHNLTTIWGQPIDRIRRKVNETKCFIMPLVYRAKILVHEFEEVLKHIEECLELAEAEA